MVDHNNVRDALFSFAVAANPGAELEPEGLIPSFPGLRHADVLTMHYAICYITLLYSICDMADMRYARCEMRYAMCYAVHRHSTCRVGTRFQRTLHLLLPRRHPRLGLAPLGVGPIALHDGGSPTPLPLGRPRFFSR